MFLMIASTSNWKKTNIGAQIWMAANIATMMSNDESFFQDVVPRFCEFLPSVSGLFLLTTLEIRKIAYVDCSKILLSSFHTVLLNPQSSKKMVEETRQIFPAKYLKFRKVAFSFAGKVELQSESFIYIVEASRLREPEEIT